MKQGRRGLEVTTSRLTRSLRIKRCLSVWFIVSVAPGTHWCPLKAAFTSKGLGRQIGVSLHRDALRGGNDRWLLGRVDRSRELVSISRCPREMVVEE